MKETTKVTYPREQHAEQEMREKAREFLIAQKWPVRNWSAEGTAELLAAFALSLQPSTVPIELTRIAMDIRSKVWEKTKQWIAPSEMESWLAPSLKGDTPAPLLPDSLVNASRADLAEAAQWCEVLYDRWENGDPCRSDSDDSLGNAFRLEYEEENKIIEVLNRLFPRPDSPAVERAGETVSPPPKSLIDKCREYALYYAKSAGGYRPSDESTVDYDARFLASFYESMRFNELATPTGPRCPKCGKVVVIQCSLLKGREAGEDIQNPYGLKIQCPNHAFECYALADFAQFFPASALPAANIREQAERIARALRIAPDDDDWNEVKLAALIERELGKER